MQNKKKLAALLLVLVMLIGAVGCSASPENPSAGAQSSASSSASSGSSAAQSTDAAPQTENPYAETVDVRVFMITDGEMDTPVTQKMEELFNINFVWNLAPKSSPEEPFNLMMASGDLDDFIVNEPDDLFSYAGKGAFLPLNDLIPEKVPSFQKLLDENDGWTRDLSYNDGNLYYFPMIAAVRTERVYYINEGWLDIVGKDVPETLEDWKDVLTAFKNTDCNGNGLADEVPFTFRGDWTYLDFYEAWGIDSGFFLEDGKILYGPYDARMYEYLAYVSDLYVNGLIDPEYITLNKDLSKEKWVNNIAGAGYEWVTRIRDNNEGNEGVENSHFIGILPPKAVEDGSVFTRHQMDQLRLTGAGAIAVSADEEVANRILALMDYNFNDDTQYLVSAGIEGVHYTLENGEVVFTDYVMNNPDGTAPRTVCSDDGVNKDWPMRQSHALESIMPQEILDTRVIYEPIILPSFPRLSFTDEEQDEVTAAMSEVQTVVDEYINKFIMGTISLDQWDVYIGKLQQAGMEKVLEHYNTAYQRYLGN